MENVGDFRGPAPGGLAEFHKVLRGAVAVVQRLDFARGEIGGGLGEFAAEAGELVRSLAGFAKKSVGIRNEHREVRDVHFRHLGGRHLGQLRPLAEVARCAQRGGSLREFEGDIAGIEHPEPFEDLNFPPEIHAGISELHALGAIDEDDEARAFADDRAVLEHRPAEQDDDEENGERAEQRQHEAEAGAHAAGVLPVKNPGRDGEDRGGNDAGIPRPVADPAKRSGVHTLRRLRAKSCWRISSAKSRIRRMSRTGFQISRP